MLAILTSGNGKIAGSYRPDRGGEIYLIFCSTWFYTCIDVLEIAKTYQDESTKYAIEQFELYREIYDTFWLDEFVISNKATTENVASKLCLSRLYHIHLRCCHELIIKRELMVAGHLWYRHCI